MDDDARDIGELQTSLLALECEISHLSKRQFKTREPEIETLAAFCVQLRSFSARLFDIQSRLLRRATNSTADEKTDSEPECHPP